MGAEGAGGATPWAPRSGSVWKSARVPKADPAPPRPSAPPARPYCAAGEGARPSPTASARPRLAVCIPRPPPPIPAPDSPWIPRGPDPPLPASRRTTRGKKEEAPADSAIVTAAAAQQRPARARAPGASLPPSLPPPARPRAPGSFAPRRHVSSREPVRPPPRAPPKGGAGCARAPALKGRVPVKGAEALASANLAHPCGAEPKAGEAGSADRQSPSSLRGVAAPAPVLLPSPSPDPPARCVPLGSSPESPDRRPLEAPSRCSELDTTTCASERLCFRNVARLARLTALVRVLAR